MLRRYFNFIATHSEKEIYDRLYPEFFGDTREHVENLVPHKRKSLPPLSPIYATVRRLLNRRNLNGGPDGPPPPSAVGRR